MFFGKHFPFSIHSKKEEERCSTERLLPHSSNNSFFLPLLPRGKKKTQILIHLYDLNCLHDLRRNSVQSEVPRSESFIVLECVNSRSHLPRCWERSSSRLGTLIPAKVQTQNSAATNTKSPADPWGLNIKGPACPQNPDIGSGRQRSNKQNKPTKKSNARKQKKKHQKIILNLKSFNCLEFELPLSPGCTFAPNALSTSPCPTQHFIGTSRFLMAFQGNSEMLAALTQINLIPQSSIHTWVWIQNHLSFQGYRNICLKERRGRICGKGTQSDVSPISLSNIPPSAKINTF